jgi:hypothetical protein
MNEKRFFVFLDTDGKYKARSWARWVLCEGKILAWADTWQEAKDVCRELTRQENEPLLNQ